MLVAAHSAQHSALQCNAAHGTCAKEGPHIGSSIIRGTRFKTSSGSKVRRSNTELTDAGPQGGPSNTSLSTGVVPNWCLLGCEWGFGVVTGVGG